MKLSKVSETDLARVVVSHLQQWGWEVYQEVEGPGGRADIVAKRGKILWAVEVKVSCGLAVIEQAFNWRWQCHYASIAVPKASMFAENVCRNYGIGILRVQTWRGEDGDVTERVKPSLCRKIRPITLHEEQKTFCDAGSNKGGHWTPFKQTVRHLITEARNHPEGVDFAKLVASIDHHYQSLSSAKSCLRGFIGTVIPELRSEIVNGKLKVFINEEALAVSDTMKRRI